MFTVVRRITRGPCVALVLVGELDLATRPEFLAQGTAVLAELRPRELTLDLSELTFLDAAGITALLVLCRAATQRAVEFRVVNAQRHVERVLTITGCHEALQLATRWPQSVGTGGRHLRLVGGTALVDSVAQAG